MKILSKYSVGALSLLAAGACTPAMLGQTASRAVEVADIKIAAIEEAFRGSQLQFEHLKRMKTSIGGGYTRLMIGTREAAEIAKAGQSSPDLLKLSLWDANAVLGPFEFSYRSIEFSLKGPTGADVAPVRSRAGIANAHLQIPLFMSDIMTLGVGGTLTGFYLPDDLAVYSKPGPSSGDAAYEPFGGADGGAFSEEFMANTYVQQVKGFFDTQRASLTGEGGLLSGESGKKFTNFLATASEYIPFTRYSVALTASGSVDLPLIQTSNMEVSFISSGSYVYSFSYLPIKHGIRFSTGVKVAGQTSGDGMSFALTLVGNLATDGVRLKDTAVDTYNKLMAGYQAGTFLETFNAENAMAFASQFTELGGEAVFTLMTANHHYLQVGYKFIYYPAGIGGFNMSHGVSAVLSINV